MARTRLSRVESKEQTRRRLLEAAARVFRRRGYRGASVEAIVAEAGYTVGAMYSNFEGKDDLLLALLEQEIGKITKRVVAAAAEAEDAIEKLRRGALEWMAVLDEEREFYVLLIEFWTLWVRDPELRSEHAKRFAALRRTLGGLVEEQTRQLGLSLRLSPEEVGAAVVALADGLSLQRLADRGAFSDDLLATLLATLIPALAEAR
jgi:AcrR family transcriptional regulator